MSLLAKITDLTGLRRLMQETTTTTVTQTLEELRASITAKRGEASRAHGAPLPPGEVVETFNAWVDEIAAFQRKEHAPGLVSRFGAPAARAHGVTGGSPWTPLTPVTWGFACLFFGATLKPQFATLVHQTEYEAGAPASERADLIARIARELGELEKTEETLVDEMTKAGIQVAHRAEVVQRREADRRRDAWADGQAVDRQRREAAIDSRHETTRRSSVSAYLEKGRM